MTSTDIPVSEPVRTSAVMDAVFRLYRAALWPNVLLAGAMTLAAHAFSDDVVTPLPLFYA